MAAFSEYVNNPDENINPKEAPHLKLGNITLSTKNKNRLSATDCGRFRSPLVLTRIVNGIDANEGSHPWMASLFLKSGQIEASAVIVNEWWLITAAHVFG